MSYKVDLVAITAAQRLFEKGFILRLMVDI